MNIQISSRFSRVLFLFHARVPSFWQLRDLCFNSATTTTTTEWCNFEIHMGKSERWLGGQSCQVPLLSWCLHQDELLVVLVVQGVTNWKGHLIIFGVGCQWMPPAIHWGDVEVEIHPREGRICRWYPNLSLLGTLITRSLYSWCFKAAQL